MLTLTEGDLIFQLLVVQDFSLTVILSGVPITDYPSHSSRNAVVLIIHLDRLSKKTNTGEIRVTKMRDVIYVKWWRGLVATVGPRNLDLMERLSLGFFRTSFSTGPWLFLLSRSLYL